ncbi:hypothetical protein [Citrobacter freundii]|uniref:hypothetical protein n=1 Tax=Citrobacter freundii TaxID=546 RepID=UPI003510BFFC
MSAFLINKLSFEDTKQIMLSSMKTMASLHGILAIFLPIIAGGGLLTLIMKNVTMEGLAFFILQPVVLTLYLTAILCRYQSSELRLNIWEELRNFIVVLVYALFLTVLMIVILWLVKFMIASAVAGETNHVEYQQPTLTREGANKRGNSSRLTQSFHFFMFEPIFSPVNALNQPI